MLRGRLHSLSVTVRCWKPLASNCCRQHISSCTRHKLPCLSGLQNIDIVRSQTQLRWYSSHNHDTDVNNSLTQEYSRKVGITKAEQKRLIQKKPEQPPNPHLLKVAIIGPPNAGKSTLANQLISWRYSAVSKKVHTTRSKSVGVLTEGDSQIIFLDTPGLTSSEKVKKHNLEKSLLTDPYSSLFEADIILAVVDISKVWNRARLDQDVLTALALHSNKRSVLILNKVDLVGLKADLLTSARILTCGKIGGKIVKHHHHDHIPVVDHNKLYENLLEKMDEKFEHKSSVTSRIMENEVFVESTESLKDQSIDIGDELNVENDEELLELKGKSAEDVEWWKTYNKRLRRAQRKTANLKGWDKFDHIFMISAVDGDGVDDIKNYLLDMSVPSPWRYHSSMVTDQDPRELATMCVWEKLLEHLPDEIPYQIQVKSTIWEVDNEQVLRACFDLVCARKRHTIHLLGNHAEALRLIAKEAKQELMNTFRTEMTLQLAVRTVAKSKPR